MYGVMVNISDRQKMGVQVPLPFHPVIEDLVPEYE